MIVRARKTTMELNPVLAPNALTVLPDLVEIPVKLRAGAWLTTTETVPHALRAPSTLHALLVAQVLAQQNKRAARA